MPVSLTVGQRTVGALDIGGTHVTAALVDVDLWRVVPGSRHRHTLDPQADAATLAAQIAEVAKSASSEARTAWGIAIPGPFDYEHGVGDFRGVGKFETLSGLDVGALLRQAGIRTGILRFVNDAHAFALGEWIAGAGRGRTRIIGTTLGTGIGSAFLVAGIPLKDGAGVPPEGRLDLIQLQGRPLEDTVSRSAIRTRYQTARRATIGRRPTSRRSLTAGAVPDIRDLAMLASAGDRIALASLRAPLITLGRVLGPRAVAFGAEAVIVGGSVSTAWAIVGDALRAGMDDASPKWSDTCQLVPAEHVQESPLIGAAWATRTCPGNEH